MAEFRTAWNRGETTESEIGSPIAKTYGYRIDKDTGKRILVETGSTNIYDMIQASHESTKLENIIKRATGDPSVLQVKDGQYVDISEMPTNMFDMQNLMLKAGEDFSKLPIEVKNKFDNSVEKYISLYGSDEWLNALGLKVATEEKKKEETKKAANKAAAENEMEGEVVNE